MLTDYDLQAIDDITANYEVDFLALTYSCSGEDVTKLRTFLDRKGLDFIKIVAKARLGLHGVCVTAASHRSLSVCYTFLVVTSCQSFDIGTCSMHQQSVSKGT